MRSPKLLFSVLTLAFFAGWSHEARAGQPQEDGQLVLSADVGKVDNGDWSTRFIQPSAELANYGPGLDVSLRGRALFARDKDFTDNGLNSTGELDGWDARAMAGIGIPFGDTVTLSVLGGAAYYHLREKQIVDDLNSSVELKSRFAAAEVGARVAVRLNDQLTWVSMAAGGPTFWGKADERGSLLGGFVEQGDSSDIKDGRVLEARTGLDILLTQNASVRAGLVYERIKFDLDDFDEERKITKKGFELGLVLKF